jgi:uncharacterized protein
METTVRTSTRSRLGFAFNRTRQTFLATELRIADTHWARLVGLLRTEGSAFLCGQGLWIVPCRGVHTVAMRYPVDVIYLDTENTVVHVEENVKPWRLTPLRTDAQTVLELPSHMAWNTGTSIGDSIEISFVAAKELAKAG